MEPEPYIVADSMSGFTVLNAIAAGVLRPKGVVGLCLSTDLGWDYAIGGAAKPITADYNISAENTYKVAIAGPDLMLQGGSVYARTPFALWSSDADTVVLKAMNTDRFAARVKASGAAWWCIPRRATTWILVTLTRRRWWRFLRRTEAALNGARRCCRSQGTRTAFAPASKAIAASI